MSDSSHTVAAEESCLALQQTYQVGMQKGDLIQGVSSGSAPRYGMLKALDQTVDLVHCRASSVIAQPLHPPFVRQTEHDPTIEVFLWCMCSQRRIFCGACAKGTIKAFNVEGWESRQACLVGNSSYLQDIWATQLCLYVTQLLPPCTQLPDILGMVLNCSAQPCSLQQLSVLLWPP